MLSFRLGTRGSPLALVQARTVAQRLREHADVEAEIVVIKTSGDRLADVRLSEFGGKGLFVKEIEEALLAGEIDLAVHSSKDMPAALPEGLELCAALPREDPRDALVLPAPAGQASFDDTVHALGASPVIGTSSVRRVAQLAVVMPHARFVPFRGNLDTRLHKLDSGEVDAIILAAAGLNRLDRAARISAFVPPEACLPAPGQGIVAVETRAGDRKVQQAVARIGDAAALDALRAERAVVFHLGGGCQMPIGAHAGVTGDRITLAAVVIALDGSRVARAAAEGAREDAETVGHLVAGRLLDAGAGDILSMVRMTDRGEPPRP